MSGWVSERVSILKEGEKRLRGERGREGREMGDEGEKRERERGRGRGREGRDKEKK